MAEFVPVEPFDIVIFGVTGDLSRQKLLPALFHRFCDAQIDETSRIIGVARGAMEPGDFMALARESCMTSTDEFSDDKWQNFSKLLEYFDVDATNEKANWDRVKTALCEDGRPRIFYLAVAPKLYVPICSALGRAGLNSENARVVLEKPIGSDLQSAEEINKGVGRVFEEHNIFRIDHYLGKETVQNLLILRFANSLFEPLWSNRSIEHIQITVAETLGAEGRDAYYDSAGAVRDIVQNHLLQLLCLIAMEPPNSLEAENIRGEKIKVLRALKGFDEASIANQTVRAQYAAGHIQEMSVDGYIDGLPENLKNSKTETYAAIKTEVVNWRWAGVPFYLRTGKRMATRRSEIVIQFKTPPHNLFGEGSSQANRLILRLQPDEGMKLYMQIKEPGPGHMNLKSIPLDLSYARSFSDAKYPDAYERLLMDVVRGNLALFMGQDEVRAAWDWTDNLLSTWKGADQKLEYYAAGTDGPLQASLLLDRDGYAWWHMEKEPV